MSTFPQLFSSLRLGQREVRNRIVSTAHGEQWSGDGLVSERLIQYYERRAKGGTGLLITFGSATVLESAATSSTVSLWDERNEAPLAEMARRVHAHGSLLLAQATHRGTRERPRGLDDPLQAPSAMPAASKLGYLGAPHILGTQEIEQILKAYASAARRLHRCGWDGVELTSLGTHLMEQFWSPVLNTRTDRYGGTFDNRMRFSLEVLERVAAAVPDSFLICFRISGDPYTDLLGLSPDDMLTIAARLDAVKRIDLFSISGGSGFSTETHAAVVPNDTYPTGTYNHLARRMKQRLSVPILVAGRILGASDAEAALAAGDCDLVGMTRALIADPDLPLHARSGDSVRTRPCIAINEGCRRVTLGMSLACSVNPGVADASLADFAPAARPRLVCVVGGGPAGMEAARVAASRGHRVKLLESSSRLGGQMYDYASVVGHPHLLGHVQWLERELERLGVEVVLGSAATKDAIFATMPAVVVVATGAQTRLPAEAYGLTMRACTDVEVSNGSVRIEPGSNVIVVDHEGRLRGPSIACAIAAAGAAQVELVLPYESACENLEPPNKPAIFKRLADSRVVCRPHLYLVGPRDGALCFRDSWSGRTDAVAEADLVVFAGHREAQAGLAEELRAARPELELLLAGDCRAPRMLRNAVSEGVRAGSLA